MNIPDYVSPIVAYRVWRWDGSGLASLIHGESWPTGHALTAQCKRVRGLCVGSNNNGHQAPQESCTCGIYAARSVDQLRGMVYRAFAICGEVYLWGVVVEHKLGWRAQFAYPKNLVVPFGMIPFDEKQARSHLEALVAYGVDIFIDDGKEQLPLWKKGSGYEPAGLDYMAKVVREQVEVSVPVAVLKEDPSRHVLLQNGRVVNHSAEIVFTDVRFLVNGPDPITYQLKTPQVKAVVFDLRPGNARLTSHAINVVRMARPDISTFATDVAIFVRVDSHIRPGAASGIGIMPDEYLEREGRNDVQSAYERFLRRRARTKGLIASPRGGTPPGSAGPPRLPPPPAVPVHSSWDISRILQCTRHRWPEQWTLAAAS